MGKKEKRRGSLRKRWLINTFSVVTAIGLVCVLLITAVFATNCFSNAVSDMKDRAETTTEFFSTYLKLSYDEYYQVCVNYVQSFEDRNNLQLQFINAEGRVEASSSDQSDTRDPETPEIPEALSFRGTRHFMGTDPGTGERIIAVSSPLIYSNGEVIGVLRYVTSTRKADIQILTVTGVSLLALLVILAILLISSSYYVRSVLKPVEEITEKAKRIAGGTYGIQIKTRYNDEIGELADTINELSSKINQNEKMQTEFISSLSHELRTPLTAITGWSETLIGDENLDTETQRGMKVILREAKRLTEMVVDLLDFTRIQDGRMTLNVEPADIRSEFEDTVFMYGSRLSQEGIELEYLDNDEDIPQITCDPKRLRQVFLNILDNAAKHGGEGKKIQASMHFEHNAVVVRIRDFGPGIPEDELPLVKKKFYKGSSKARGSGIGLAVCDEIVQMHGGTLTLENPPEGGTLVTVEIPAAQ